MTLNATAAPRTTEIIDDEIVSLPAAPQLNWDGKILDHFGTLDSSYDSPQDALKAIKTARADSDETFVYVATQVGEGDLAGRWIVEKYYAKKTLDVDLDEIAPNSLPAGSVVVDETGKVGLVRPEKDDGKVNAARSRNYFGGSVAMQQAEENERARQASNNIMEGLDAGGNPTSVDKAFDVDKKAVNGFSLRK